MTEEEDKIYKFSLKLKNLDSNLKLGDEYYYRSISFCIIDAVYSVGIRYTTVKNAISKYAEYYNIDNYYSEKRRKNVYPDQNNQESNVGFYKKINKLGPKKLANQILRNRNRTSSKNGILKSEAVIKFSEVLKEYKVDYLQDIDKIINNKQFEKEIKSIPGQGSGLSLKYFFMLTGNENLIKPDRHIKRYIQNIIGRNVGDDEAENMLRRVYKKLKEKHKHLTLRSFDYMIWSYQRKQ